MRPALNFISVHLFWQCQPKGRLSRAADDLQIPSMCTRDPIRDAEAQSRAWHLLPDRRTSPESVEYPRLLLRRDPTTEISYVYDHFRIIAHCSNIQRCSGWGVLQAIIQKLP